MVEAAVSAHDRLEGRQVSTDCDDPEGPRDVHQDSDGSNVQRVERQCKVHAENVPDSAVCGFLSGDEHKHQFTRGMR